MVRCAAAGILPNQFWDLPFDETVIALAGYEQRMTNEWQQTRVIAYTIACTVTEKDERGDIYQLFPLPGDPTPEEIQAAQQQQYEEMIAHSRHITELVREQMNKK